MIRYFHQPKEYWLEHGTLQDWHTIYSRELLESPPVDDMVADYLGYERPVRDEGESEAVDLGLPDIEA